MFEILPPPGAASFKVFCKDLLLAEDKHFFFTSNFSFRSHRGALAFAYLPTETESMFDIMEQNLRRDLALVSH